MKKSPFVQIFEDAAKEVLGETAIVRSKAILYYSLSLDRKLCLLTPNTKEPKRGLAAFQTDICIFENVEGVEFPRVVIEFKERITTHDILTYSAKSGKHKQIYPCLRYGLLASEEVSIPRRFFTHNEHLDFFIAAKEYKESEKVRVLARQLIDRELRISQTLEDIHFSGKKVDYFCRDIVFGKFDEKETAY
jgi:hypothetical protein